MLMFVLVFIYIYIHTHTYTHTYIHTYTHTYAHTDILRQLETFNITYWSSFIIFKKLG